MRILVCDYSGHPFQVELSRALAGAGHTVLHLFTGSSETPKGDLIKRSRDPESFDIRMVKLDEPFNKTDFVKRRSQERQIGRLFGTVIDEFRPDLIVASNCPIETLKFVLKAKVSVGARFVFWLQDLLGEATSRVLSKRMGLAGRMVGSYFQQLEKRMLRSADHIVAIADDFVPILRDRYHINPAKVTVIENWSPIGDIPVLPRDNDWAAENLQASSFRIVYSGTLGFKQDPALLLELARHTSGQVLVFSEGVVARELAENAKAQGIVNLEVRPWLDFADLPYALAAADLLVVVLEPDAGVFSVPSKVLTYLCAGRPILGAINADNLAAKIISGAGAGFVAPPGDHHALIAAAKTLQNDPEQARRAGEAGRRYAERTFDIDVISGRFLSIIENIENVKEVA